MMAWGNPFFRAARRDLLLVMGVWLLLGAGLAARVPLGIHLLAGFCFSLGLAVMGLTDIRWGLLLDKVNLILLAAGVFFLLLEGRPLWLHLAGGASGGLILYVLRLVSRGGLGLGDVKFGVVLGVWLGPPLLYVAFLLAFVMGGGFAALLLLLRQIRWNARLPFGPFLAAGAYLSFLCGKDVLAWYGALL